VTIFVIRDAIREPQANVAAVLFALPLPWAMQLGDLAMVSVTRLRRGESPIRGGTDHTSHRLLNAGLSDRGMLLVVGATGAGIAALGVGAVVAGDSLGAAAGLVIGVAIAIAFEGTIVSRYPLAKFATQPNRPPATREEPQVEAPDDKAGTV
jgi:UDP-GlcNAc:undecaprenyl-phosphate GlcNAc-1-phosphate transferase